MADASALYPQPPKQTEGLLSGDPTKIIGLIGGLNQNALFQQTFGARKAIGSAYQDAIQSDGSIDTKALMEGIKSRPDAGFMAGEASAGALTRQQQQIANTTAQFDQSVKQHQFIVDGLGTLADNPNVSHEDVRRFAVTAAKNTGVPSPILNSLLGNLPKDPAKLRPALVTMRNMAIGSGNLSTPTGTGFQPSGAPIMGSRGQFNFQAAGPGGARTGPPGIAAPPPGQVEAASSIAQAGAGAAAQLREANDTSMTRKGMLGNLEEDLHNFTAGPGADWQKVAKSWVNRNVPLPTGWQFDPKAIASQEQFNKQAGMLAQQQFGMIGGTGTDAKFNSAFSTSPNEALSQLGNQGIIRLLKGNEDAIQAKNKAWLSWKKQYGPHTYDEFSQDFTSRFDPRAFQFKYMTPQDRQTYINRMDPNDRARFIQDLTYAHKQGWISHDNGTK